MSWLAVFAFILVVFAWQVYAEVNNEQYWAPAVFLSWLADQARKAGGAAGEYVARLSSFIHCIIDWLHFEKMWAALVHLLEPILRLFISPVVAFFRRYFTYATTGWSYPGLIVIGTIVGAAVLVYVASFFEISHTIAAFIVDSFNADIVRPVVSGMVIIGLALWIAMVVAKPGPGQPVHPEWVVLQRWFASVF